MINFKVFTLFPEIFPGPLAASIIGSAQRNNLWKIEAINPRNYATDLRKTVDDTPYGGGAGMLLKCDVMYEALSQNVTPATKIIYPSPRGKLFNQDLAGELAQNSEIAFLCGRYEGVDQRVLDELSIEEVSIGDYILSGGELAVLVMIDAILRNVEGVVGDKESLSEESFSGSEEYRFLLEYPHYTRPTEWRGRKVPEVLLSGNHRKIKEWRLAQAIELTKKRRPDLYQKFCERVKK